MKAYPYPNVLALKRCLGQTLTLHAPARISFEHAWFLLIALARRDEIGAARCEVCGGVRLRDLLAKRRSSCANCEPPGAPVPAAAEAAPC